MWTNSYILQLRQILRTNLEIVGQLGAAGVPGVHGDEHGAGGVEGELGALEEELLLVGLDGALDAVDLLRHHGQHLQLDAVELVEARPGAGLRQPLEELAHGLVVETVGAVEHHALRLEGEKRKRNITNLKYMYKNKWSWTLHIISKASSILTGLLDYKYISLK